MISLDLPQKFLAEAAHILASTPLIDGHNDWPHLIRGFYDNRLQKTCGDAVIERFGPKANLVGHVDLRRMREGKLGGVFLSAYVDCPNKENDFSDEVHFEVLRDSLQQIDLIHRLIDSNKNCLELVYRAQDILPAFQGGKIACLIGAEGLHQIANSASVLRLYHRLGVRYVTLTHNENNMYADSATAKAGHFHGGLSNAGRSMVTEMNRIGMIVDLAHVSESTMRQALGISAAPVAITHSSIHRLCPHVRNVSDECLDLLKANDGIIMISLIPDLTYVDASKANVHHVVDHILYAAKRIGYDHVGIGSDFDGMEKSVEGVEDISLLSNLVAALLMRGVQRHQIEQILGLNVIRVLEAVEKVAKDLSRELAVLEDPIKQLWGDSIREYVRSVYTNCEE